MHQTLSALEKYWLSIAFALLVLVSAASSYLAVAAALVFTFLVPGLIAHRFFHLNGVEKYAFVPVFSVVVSVQLIYWLSILVGYSRWSILLGFTVLTALYTTIVYFKGETIKPLSLLQLGKIRKTNILLFALIFIISLSVLAVSVWRGNDYGIVLTGSNWQDTPMHYEIIESINNGNFPPQTPSYAGTPLTYHYFVDFHTSIVEAMYGYLPTSLPVLNAIFILVFSVVMYALVRDYGIKAAFFAAIVGVFGWGFSYFCLFQALIDGTFTASTNYIYQFSGLFGLPSPFDNLLQQRPLLIGLPVFALVLLLLRNMKDQNRLLLAGVLTGLVFPFHSVAFFCCYVVFAAAVIFNLRKINLGYIYFLLPSICALPFIFSGGPPMSFSVSAAFFGDFVLNNSPLLYYFANLGIPLVLALISFVKPGHEYVKLSFLALFMIPNILLLTPWSWDMYKFFIFAWVPIVLLASILLAKVSKRVVCAVILLSVITASSVIIYNVGTDYTALTWSEYDAALWIKDNTPQNSVFLTYYSIQCPVTMVAGRLRVDAYVYWSYGHGEPLDEVYGRQNAIDNAYGGNQSELAELVGQYNVSYVYVGGEEQRQYSGCVAHMDSIGWLKQVYSQNSLYVYQVDTAQMNTSVPTT